MNKQQLIEAVSNGLQPEFLFFWGHRQKGHDLGKSCLSQWYPARFELKGELYLSAEHFMMAEKAFLFGDEDTRARILATSSPAEAKALGRQVRGFDSHLWEARCFDIVVQGNEAKFSQNDALGQFLIATGNRILVEASPLDLIWGIGLAEDNPLAGRPEHWPGLNLLGFALMKVREHLHRT